MCDWVRDELSAQQGNVDNCLLILSDFGGCGSGIQICLFTVYGFSRQASTYLKPD